MKHVNLLKSNGYLILRNCIPKKFLRKARVCAAEMLNCRSNYKDILKNMILLEKKSKKKFYDFCCSFPLTTSISEISSLKKFIDIAEKSLKCKSIYTSDCKLFFNKKDVKRLQLDWHCEQSYFPKVKREVLSMQFPWLNNVNEFNGTMIMAEKSNLKKKYKINKIKKKHNFTQMKINDSDIQKFKLINCNLKLGDVVFFNKGVVHKTGFNKSKLPRSTIIVRYVDYTGKFKS